MIHFFTSLPSLSFFYSVFLFVGGAFSAFWLFWPIGVSAPSSPSPLLTFELSLTVTNFVSSESLFLSVWSFLVFSLIFSSFYSADFSSLFFCLCKWSILLPFYWWDFLNSLSWAFATCHYFSVISRSYSSLLSLCFFSSFPG